jgi:hypothetical protein
MKVSIFKSIKNTSPYGNRDVGKMLDRIRDGKSKKIVDQIRLEPDIEKKKQYKLELPVVCFNGQFNKRSISGLEKASGLMVLDFDDLQNPTHKKQQIAAHKSIFAAWISPRGNGVKALIRIPLVDNDKDFKKIYNEVQKIFPDIDDSGKDISRACFESYDSEIYVNINADVFEVIIIPDVENERIGVTTNVPITDQDEIANRLMVWFKKHWSANQRNNSLFKLAMAFNDFGISKTTCQTYLSPFEEPDFKLDEILQLINSAYKRTESFGSQKFEDKEKKKEIVNYVVSGKSSDELVKIFPDISKELIQREVEIVKNNIDLSVFWDVDKNGNIKINAYRFKIFLQKLDYFKFYPIDKTKTFLLITKKQNFINVVSEFEIKDHLLNRLIDNNKIDVFNVIANETRLFSPQYLSILETANIAIERDGKDFSMLFFKNNAVKVFKDYIEIYDYNELDGFVWENQIIERDFKECDHHESIFRSFVWFISGQEVGRYNTFKSIIGYLLHSYKTSANNRAIILNDETISDMPNGGSGKGILVNAIGQMKRLSTIDGKTFDFNKSFAYQTVSTDCQVLFYDDVKKNFEFERLFSQITEGITIEYKNQGAVKLPVQDSPKIVISTNYTIKTEGGSFERRVFEIEFSSYFNSSHTPIDEFGQMFFEDWDSDEWHRFDKYMINCLQYYLENGLVKSEPKNLMLRKAINETCQEFWDFVEDGLIPINQKHGKGEMYAKFKEENEELRFLTKRIFMKWVKKYADYKEYGYEEGNSNGRRWFLISDSTYVKTPF